MMTPISFRPIALISLIMLIGLPGCMAFSDSSAMRIEVEVYKGPLSLEPDMQLGELYGYITEARLGLENTQEFIRRVAALDSPGNTKVPIGPVESSEMCGSKDMGGQINCSILLALDGHSALFVESLASLGCKLINDSPCTTADNDLSKLIDTALKKITSQMKASQQSGALSKEDVAKETELLNDAIKNITKTRDLHKTATIKGLARSQSTLSTPNKAELQDALTAANQIAAAMQAAAFRYAIASTAGQSNNYTVRIALTYFIVATSEYGNQIQARADALMKQLNGTGRDRRELPLSTHLRESEPTDFVHLFNWMHAHVPFSDVEERVKIMDRLYSDHFWSKINTVYASGRGKTQMAFIKDETGNWNLKSFDNDPTELLDAYTKVTKAALEGVVKVTQDMASGGISTAGKTLANQLLTIADQTAPDKPQAVTAPAGTLSLSHLQNRLLTQLDKDAPENSALKKNLADDKDNIKAFNDEPAANTIKKEELRQALNKHREAVIKKWTEQIDDHSHLVDLLSTTVKNK